LRVFRAGSIYGVGRLGLGVRRGFSTFACAAFGWQCGKNDHIHRISPFFRVIVQKLAYNHKELIRCKIRDAIAQCSNICGFAANCRRKHVTIPDTHYVHSFFRLGKLSEVIAREKTAQENRSAACSRFLLGLSNGKT
jgi:hypothetical protein